jgi:4-hydroxy-tetrahydrodipicolinate reductase
VTSVRAGDIVGDHTVLYAGPHERVELTHRAHSRAVFASGALKAAAWIAGREPGFYDYMDLLALKGLI